MPILPPQIESGQPMRLRGPVSPSDGSHSVSAAPYTATRVGRMACQLRLLWRTPCIILFMVTVASELMRLMELRVKRRGQSRSACPTAAPRTSYYLAWFRAAMVPLCPRVDDGTDMSSVTYGTPATEASKVDHVLRDISCRRGYAHSHPNLYSVLISCLHYMKSIPKTFVWRNDNGSDACRHR
ncbi:hypothetical protein TgHK011_007664 [Trichoderma gracile]|nr:hypothetical protein TgHK011_007664 [Trichoderma gracile]